MTNRCRRLPEKVAFANIDIGFGGREARAEAHAAQLIHVLESVYARMPPGAIASVSDYWDRNLHSREIHEDWGVTRACERFFADKPEEICVLYAGAFTQGYFRKI